MKRTLLVLTLLVGVIFTLGAGASTASASANCLIQDGPTVWQPEGNYLRFFHRTYACSNVDMVELVIDPCATYGVLCGTNNKTGWRDWTTGGMIEADNSTSPLTVLCGRQYTTFTGECNMTYYHHPWCGGAVHSVYTQVFYRIHDKTAQTWHWWNAATGIYAIQC